MSKKQKRMLFRVLASAVLFAVALLLPTEGWLRLFTFLIPYAVIAWDVLWRAVRNIAHGQVKRVWCVNAAPSPAPRRPAGRDRVRVIPSEKAAAWGFLRRR